MIGQLSKTHFAMLAAFLVAVAVPVRAEDSAIGDVRNCPAAVGVSGLRPALESRLHSILMGITEPSLTERPAFLVLPEHGVLSLPPWAGIEDSLWSTRNTAFDAVGVADDRAGDPTPGRDGRLARFLHHVTWSWDPSSPNAVPFQTGTMPNRP
jgi:hypothetical protein